MPGVKGFAKVSASLYRGAQPSRTGFVSLSRFGIRTVVNLRAFHSDRRAMAGLGLHYVHIYATAWNPEAEDLAAFLQVVREPGNRPVFVHCMHGVDRTGFAVAAYRMIVQRWPRERAIAELHAFGFHPIWKHSIGRYLRRFELGPFRRMLRITRAPKPRLVP